ncbi:hypothetical protein CDD80_2823 [Ophiocordyceps camponoti-rufipedis]|uniref:Uncharacterized protein n=1 Tax=Ophiocordyceps camponoti-rufipedis TaxID=2004952 RepID=A0A2C5Z4C4_9HYPO|nr:hypothetical protein CDD80_2823 [Ophiocordyceps camponoti-rufipedis]
MNFRLFKTLVLSSLILAAKCRSVKRGNPLYGNPTAEETLAARQGPWDFFGNPVVCHITVITGPITVVYRGKKYSGHPTEILEFYPIENKQTLNAWVTPTPLGWTLKGPGRISFGSFTANLDDKEEAQANSRLGETSPTMETVIMPLRSSRCQDINGDTEVSPNNEYVVPPNHEYAGDRMAKLVKDTNFKTSYVAKLVANDGKTAIQMAKGSYSPGRTSKSKYEGEKMAKSFMKHREFKWQTGRVAGESGDALSPNSEGWSSNKWMNTDRSAALKMPAENDWSLGGGDTDSSDGWTNGISKSVGVYELQGAAPRRAGGLEFYPIIAQDGNSASRKGEINSHPLFFEKASNQKSESSKTPASSRSTKPPVMQRANKHRGPPAASRY